MNNTDIKTDTKYYTAVCSSGGLGTSKSKYIGYECAVASELLPDRARFHQGVHPETKMVYGDFTTKINEIARLHIEKNCEGILFTLPCQPFSLAGGQHLGDDLTWLFLDALKLIKKIIELGGILNWLMWENAPYFISNKQDAVITDRLGGKTILQHITDALGQYSFLVHAKILDASFYGTAQARKRGIILCRRDRVWNFPVPDDKQLTCFDVIGDNYIKKVYCIRGADFPSLTGHSSCKAPIRFILNKNSSKILSSGDLVIEISGGSPTQSTGRIGYINQHVLERFDDDVITSNFCKALSLNNKNTLYNFYLEWERLYKSGLFFNYEGKTTGIKNLLFDTFVESYKIAIPPQNIINAFYDTVRNIFEKIQCNAKENHYILLITSCKWNTEICNTSSHSDFCR